MADRTPATPPPTPPAPVNPWPKTVLWMFVFGAIGLNTAIFLRSCRDMPGDAIEKTGNAITKAGRAMADVASAFTRGTITTEFTSYATTVTNQQFLQFATLKQREIFTRSESGTTGFGYIPLPEVIVEARAPVEYTYHLDLNGSWKFVLQDGVVHVYTPPIRFNRPAVDVSAITYEVKKGLLKTDQALENLKQSITSLVTLKARENIPLVRENGRRQTAEFVERWLMKSFTDGKQYTVQVHFPDEKPAENTPILPAPLR